MDNSKITAMMAGKTLEKNNIQKMYDMVQSASDMEEKKSVKKHSVLFVGQLPLDDNQNIDLLQTERILNARMPYEEVAHTEELLLDALTTQKLLIQDGDCYKLNLKYENAIVKARKIAKAYQIEQNKFDEDTINRAKKYYRQGTKLYNRGDYEEAMQYFLNAARTAEYRMAYYSIGMMYHDGKGVDPSPLKALSYVRKALVLGVAIAVPLEEELLKEISEA